MTTFAPLMKKNHLILVCIVGVIIAVMPQRVQAQIDPGDTNLNGSLVTLNTITTAVPFMMIAPDSRSGALGDCGVAPVSYTHLTLPTIYSV